VAEFILGFILGLAFAAALLIGFASYHLKNLKKDRPLTTEEKALRDSLLADLRKKSEELKSKVSKIGVDTQSIKDRLIKASELAQTQMMLRAQAEQPSKNSLDSRYKNGLIGELNSLEKEKLDLLKSILADGFDPKITVYTSAGEKQEMLLSAYVDEALGIVSQSLPTEDLPPGVKRMGKFVVHQGGKGDEGATH